MEELKECPLCGEKEFVPVFKAPYFRGEEEYFQIQECKSCSFWFTNPRPREGKELDAYYATEDYVSHTDSRQSLIDRIYLVVRNYALRKKLMLAQAVAGGKGQLLDYGAGTGAFVEYAKNHGWDAVGIEPSEVARNQGAKKGVSLFDPENTEALSERKFDIISLWHVLEHLPNLKKDFQNLVDHLRPGGALIIAVPNHESWDARHYGANWAALDIPLHLYHFKKKNMAQLANQFGLHLSDIENMPFDAFYVSMLSEKIAHGKSNFLRAFFNGLKSNLKGRGNKKNMSSLIYVFKKS